MVVGVSSRALPLMPTAAAMVSSRGCGSPFLAAIEDCSNLTSFKALGYKSSYAGVLMALFFGGGCSKSSVFSSPTIRVSVNGSNSIAFSTMER